MRLCCYSLCTLIPIVRTKVVGAIDFFQTSTTILSNNIKADAYDFSNKAHHVKSQYSQQVQWRMKGSMMILCGGSMGIRPMDQQRKLANQHGMHRRRLYAWKVCRGML